MPFGKVRVFPLLLLFVVTTCMLARAKCPVDVVVTKGRVEHVPPNAKVRVRLIYRHRARGESGEIKLEGAEFTVPVDFFTQSRGPVLFGEWLERCDRKPEAVVVSLMGGDPVQEYYRLTLTLRADFKETSPGEYALKSEIVLKGPG